MFSATFGAGVQHLAADFLDAYTFVAVGRVGSAAQTVQQRLLWVEDSWDGLPGWVPNTDLNMVGFIWFYDFIGVQIPRRSRLVWCYKPILIM